MSKIKKIHIAHTPTPIEILKDFPHPATIFIKRDDFTGLITSGNKVRKLEYALADARAQNADTIITCGGIQSNHCRATAVCCRLLGLTPLLVLRGEPIKPYDGNLLLDYLLGSEIRYITRVEYEEVNDIMENIAQDLIRNGNRPYIIPEGASNEVGLLGYVDCMAEMREFIEREKIEAIYVAVGSGGTYAGLLLGKKLYRVKADLLGVIICDTVQFFEEKIFDITEKAI
ncbi:MAG: pyridoxal-phosphate dependent enzyme, partial [candidate division WOR-3 bacterium]